MAWVKFQEHVRNLSQDRIEGLYKARIEGEASFETDRRSDCVQTARGNEVGSADRRQSRCYFEEK
jgi:hypothetical protein